MNKPVVYLSGGMRGSWREFVRGEFSNLNNSIGFIDPQENSRGLDASERRKENFKKPEVFKTWNTLAIKNSDVVFIHVEKENPSGLGAMLELGYAKGLGKTTVLVVEPREDGLDSYFNYGRQLSDVSFDNLGDGVDFLRSLIGK